MSYQSTYGSGLSADTRRQPSPSLWKDCPVSEIQAGLVDGCMVWDDFACFPNAASAQTTNIGISQWKYFSSTSASPLPIADAATYGGAIAFSSDGNDEGASLMSGTSAFLLNSANGKLWFECRIKTASIAATTGNFFVGLCEQITQSATVPLTAAGALSDNNMFGFHRGEGASADSGVVDFAYKADGVTAVRVKAAAATLTAATYVKLGFVMDPIALKITYFVNGVPDTATTKTVTASAGTDYPADVALAPVIAHINGATTGTTTVDWIRCAQIAL